MLYLIVSIVSILCIIYVIIYKQKYGKRQTKNVPKWALILWKIAVIYLAIVILGLMGKFFWYAHSNKGKKSIDNRHYY